MLPLVTRGRSEGHALEPVLHGRYWLGTKCPQHSEILDGEIDLEGEVDINVSFDGELDIGVTLDSDSGIECE